MIQFKRGKTASWATQTEPLADGQPGYDKDTHELKIGDGTTSFANLPAIGSGYAAGLETTSNKVTSISSTSTNDQYPSAKAVYTQLSTKEVTSNKVTSLSSSSTNTQYPGAKLVYDQLALKQSSSYKTTSVSSGSSDTYYPSAKAVYTFVNNNYAKTTSGTCTLTAYSYTSTTSIGTATCNYYKCGRLVTIYGTFPSTGSTKIYKLTGLPYVPNTTASFGWHGSQYEGIAYVTTTSSIFSTFSINSTSGDLITATQAASSNSGNIQGASTFTVTYITAN